MIHAKRQTPGHTGLKASVEGVQSHGNRLQRGITVTLFADMPPDAFGVPVVHGGEDPDPSLFGGENPGAIGPPHQVRRQSGDFAVMTLGRLGPAPEGRKQLVLPHQAQDPLAGHAHAIAHSQPRPDLAMSLAGKGGAFQIGTDQLKQCLIAGGGARATALRRWAGLLGRRLKSGVVEGGASLLPDPADPMNAVRLFSARGDRLAHFDDLRLAKGPGFLTRCQRSSFSMVSSPMRRMA